MSVDREGFVRRHFKTKAAALLAAANLPSHVRKLLEYSRTFYEMAFDKRYKLPRATKGLLVFSLFYFVMPFDAIPDVIPLTGLVDDFAVASYLFVKLGEQIAKYRQWRLQQGPVIDLDQ